MLRLLTALLIDQELPFPTKLLRSTTRLLDIHTSKHHCLKTFSPTIKMFARQLTKGSSSLRASSSLTRAFSTSIPLQRSPALADITPEGVTSFDAKQKEFRARVAAQSKKKVEASTSSSDPITTPTAPSVGNARKSNTVSTLTVGSQSPVETESPAEEHGKKAGPITNLIYGTKEGREMDLEMNNSFSQVLARGKYVHSIVFHEVKPDKVDEYVKLVGSWYPRMAGMPENKVHLVGSWRTEVGDCDTFGMFNSSSVYLHRDSGANWLKSISGNTNATMVTTTPFTASPTTPSSPPLTPS